MRRALLILLASLAGASPTADPYWHVYADLVALPALQAALNKFVLEHPKDPEGQENRFPHTHGFDVRTKANVDAIEAAYKDWRAAMKKGGY